MGTETEATAKAEWIRIPNSDFLRIAKRPDLSQDTYHRDLTASNTVH